MAACDSWWTSQTEIQPPRQTSGLSTVRLKTSGSLVSLHRPPSRPHCTIPPAWRALDQGSDPDVEFECGGQSTSAHGAVVCARSPVMASMLNSHMLEGRTRVIKIPDIEPDVFRHFLRYIYTGTLPDLTLDLALNLYEAGDQYAVHGLARRCSEYLMEHLSVQDACEILVVADAHSNAELREAVIDFIVANRVPRASDRWKDFCKGHPVLAIEVLDRFCP